MWTLRKSRMNKKGPKWLTGPNFKMESGSPLLTWGGSGPSHITLCSWKNHKLNFVALAWACFPFNCQARKPPEIPILPSPPEKWTSYSWPFGTAHFPHVCIPHLEWTGVGTFLCKPASFFVPSWGTSLSYGRLCLLGLQTSFWNKDSPVLNSFPVDFCWEFCD